MEVPTLVEELGGVQVIIKRETLYAIQRSGRIDPKTGGLAKDYNTHYVTETTSTLARKTGVSRRTIARDMDVLKEKGFVVRIVADNGGYWMRLK